MTHMSSDIDKPETTTSSEASDLIGNLGRRSVLLGLGGLAGGATFAAHAKDKEVKKQTNIPDKPDGPAKDKFSNDEFKGDAWVAEKHGNFNLADPRENQLATLKMTNNLAGKRSYVVMFSRGLLGPQGTGGSVLYGHMGFWTWQLQKLNKEEFPDAPDGTVVQRAMYTGMILDPFTYEPTDTIYNEYLDKNVTPTDSLFAETYLLYPNGGLNSVDRDNFIQDDPEVRKKLKASVQWGDEMAIFLDGIFQSEGPHQPRMDNSIWTANRKKVMDPNTSLVETDYNFAGILRAWSRPWIGIGKDDDTQILWNVKGKKVHSVDDFPEMVRKNLVTKYPDRV